jgi:quercetin dioxygenase-like cupin family protein
MADPRYRKVAAGEGETLWFAGAHQTIKHPGAWSAGKFSLVEVVVPRGRATPLHRDPSDETFYILEGEVLFHVDDLEHLAVTGDTISLQQGVPHAFTVTSDTARFLVLNTPGTHDRYFRDGGEPATHSDLNNAPSPNHQRIEKANAKHGIEILGPPPFDAALLSAG